MTTEEKIAVMQAFVDKKTIEYRVKGGEWVTTSSFSTLSWDWWNHEYRIKQEPKYKPFDFSDAESLIGKIVKSKNGDYIGLIVCAYENNNFIVIGESRVGYNKLFIDFTFLDGSPCGKLKQ